MYTHFHIPFEVGELMGLKKGDIAQYYIYMLHMCVCVLGGWGGGDSVCLSVIGTLWNVYLVIWRGAGGGGVGMEGSLF